ncbi:hypothetical protein QJQ45_027055 [Haematococcus lacustris]|nr:hypothetical protein QJQ45_027055 [Haematococcus lacustris]
MWSSSDRQLIRAHIREQMRARGLMQFIDDEDHGPSASQHAVAASAHDAACRSVIASGVRASSTDHELQGINNTLNQDDSFWSSSGSWTTNVDEHLLFRLASPLTRVHSVTLRVYRYPPLAVSILVGPSPSLLLPASPRHPCLATDAPQVFKLDPAAPPAAYLMLRLHGKPQCQMEDMQYYLAIRSVTAHGQLLPCQGAALPWLRSLLLGCQLTWATSLPCPPLPTHPAPPAPRLQQAGSALQDQVVTVSWAEGQGGSASTQAAQGEQQQGQLQWWQQLAGQLQQDSQEQHDQEQQQQQQHGGSSSVGLGRPGAGGAVGEGQPGWQPQGPAACCLAAAGRASGVWLPLAGQAAWAAEGPQAWLTWSPESAQAPIPPPLPQSATQQHGCPAAPSQLGPTPPVNSSSSPLKTGVTASGSGWVEMAVGGVGGGLVTAPEGAAVSRGGGGGGWVACEGGGVEGSEQLLLWPPAPSATDLRRGTGGTPPPGPAQQLLSSYLVQGVDGAAEGAGEGGSGRSSAQGQQGAARQGEYARQQMQQQQQQEQQQQEPSRARGWRVWWPARPQQPPPPSPPPPPPQPHHPGGVQGGEQQQGAPAAATLAAQQQRGALLPAGSAGRRRQQPPLLHSIASLLSSVVSRLHPDSPMRPVAEAMMRQLHVDAAFIEDPFVMQQLLQIHEDLARDEERQRRLQQAPGRGGGARPAAQATGQPAGAGLQAGQPGAEAEPRPAPRPGRARGGQMVAAAATRADGAWLVEGEEGDEDEDEEEQGWGAGAGEQGPAAAGWLALGTLPSDSPLFDMGSQLHRLMASLRSPSRLDWRPAALLYAPSADQPGGGARRAARSRHTTRNSACQTGYGTVGTLLPAVCAQPWFVTDHDTDHLVSCS